ncbi:MAG: redoxin domain-containing protein [Clostridia bacterium]|nr:redoxin domain-containing protein [Clostridia bacterium]
MIDSTSRDEVAVIIANLSSHDDIDQAKKIISDHGLEEYSYYDVDNEIGKNYDVIGVPAAFYIDPEGIIKNFTFSADDAKGILDKISE